MTPEQLSAIERAAREAIEARNAWTGPADEHQFDVIFQDSATVLALVALARRAEELEMKLAAVESTDARERARTLAKIEGRSLGD